MLDGDHVVALPGAYDRTETECQSRRTGERERPVESGERGLKVAPGDGDDKARSGQCRRIVAAGSDRVAGMAQSCDPGLLLHSTPQVPLLMAPGDDRMRGGK